MDVAATLTCPSNVAAMYAVVSDLGRYPEWLDIVPAAVPVDGDEHDPGPAWSVDLRGQLGPLRRTKRLRMVRSVADAPRTVRFERRELDGRSHSPWVMTAEVSDEHDGGDVTLSMSLHYGGTLWVPALDRVLADEIRRGRSRLAALVGTSAGA
jgi:Polyketide cyclase / dehydrase and lipid transport